MNMKNFWNFAKFSGRDWPFSDQERWYGPWDTRSPDSQCWAVSSSSSSLSSSPVSSKSSIPRPISVMITSEVSLSISCDGDATPVDAGGRSVPCGSCGGGSAAARLSSPEGPEFSRSRRPRDAAVRCRLRPLLCRRQPTTPRGLPFTVVNL